MKPSYYNAFGIKGKTNEHCNYMRFLKLSYHLQCSVTNCITSCVHDLDLRRIYFINNYWSVTIFTKKWKHNQKPIRWEAKFAFN
jgi:hypothetical protein